MSKYDCKTCRWSGYCDAEHQRVSGGVGFTDPVEHCFYKRKLKQKPKDWGAH